MADNVAFTPGSGATGAADDIGGVMYARVKLSLGADGSASDAIDGAGAVGVGVQRVTLASNDPAVTALQIIDDWDESDRAKVNLIEGQAGITAGAGAVGASTPRVTLASDDPGVALLTTIDADTGSMATLLGTIDADTGSMATLLGTIDADTGSMATLLGTIDTDTGNIATSSAAVAKSVEGDYETVAASQTAQTLGATGAIGDYISHVLVIPATTSPGNVILLDNATSITIFTGGADSVSNLVPFAIPLNMVSASGAWKITTGANVSVIGVGSFTA